LARNCIVNHGIDLLYGKTVLGYDNIMLFLDLR